MVFIKRLALILLLSWTLLLAAQDADSTLGVEDASNDSLPQRIVWAFPMKIQYYSSLILLQIYPKLT